MLNIHPASEKLPSGSITEALLSSKVEGGKVAGKIGQILPNDEKGGQVDTPTFAQLLLAKGTSVEKAETDQPSLKMMAESQVQGEDKFSLELLESDPKASQTKISSPFLSAVEADLAAYSGPEEEVATSLLPMKEGWQGSDDFSKALTQLLDRYSARNVSGASEKAEKLLSTDGNGLNPLLEKGKGDFAETLDLVGDHAEFKEELIVLAEKEFSVTPKTPAEWQALITQNLPKNEQVAAIVEGESQSEFLRESGNIITNPAAKQKFSAESKDSVLSEVQATEVHAFSQEDHSNIVHLDESSKRDITVFSGEPPVPLENDSQGSFIEVSSEEEASELTVDSSERQIVAESDGVSVLQPNQEEKPVQNQSFASENLKEPLSKSEAQKEVQMGVEQNASDEVSIVGAQTSAANLNAPLSSSTTTSGNTTGQAGSNPQSMATQSNGLASGQTMGSASNGADSSQNSQSNSQQKSDSRADDLAQSVQGSKESKNDLATVSKTAGNVQQLAQQMANLMASGKESETGAKNTILSQMVQSQQRGLEQQASLRASEATLWNSTLDVDGNPVSDVTAIGDRRANLPPGLQTIPLPVKHPQWGQALGQRVVFMANSQLQQAQITLNPEKLGPIQIKLHMDRDQQMQVSLNAQHGVTKEALENAIPRLREMLEQSGVQLASVDVGDFSQFAEQQAEAEDDTGSTSATQLAGTSEESESDSQQTVQAGTDTLVDYYA